MSDNNHIDTDTLNMLKEVMEDGFENLLNTFISDSKGRIEDLRQAISVGDDDGVRRAAHSLKGSSGNLGANPLAALCLSVESRGKDGDLSGLETELEKIEQEYQQVAAIMKAML
jgi:HPt (histidine-containing phosphotransfer) domain-containing protein